MPEPLFTRCPECRTTFRVRPEQLAARGGTVRCGVCRAVFSAESHTLDVPRRVAETTIVSLDEGASGPETVTLAAVLVPGAASAGTGAVPGGGPVAATEGHGLERSALAAAASPGSSAQDVGAPAAQDVRAPAAAAPEAPGRADGIPSSDEEAAAPTGAIPAPAVRRTAERASRGQQAAGWAFAALLVLLLASQAVWYYRHALAAHFPATRPWLAQACGTLGCSIDPVRELDRVSIEGSDLQADPAHQGLLTLTALLRNQAPFAVALPHLELTLTDAQDRTLVRKVLSPAEYAPTTPAATGFPGTAEIAVKLFLDGSGLAPGGYRLALFYP